MKEKQIERRRGGKTIFRRGQGLTLLTQLVQLKAGLGGKGLLKIHLWCVPKRHRKIIGCIRLLECF